MDKAVLDFVVEKTKALISIPYCCDEAKTAGKEWLDAVGTDKQTEQTEKFIKELEEDMLPIDMLIDFAESEHGAEVFGADVAKSVAEHGKDIKNKGAKYCDCEACSAVGAILEKKEELLK